MNSVLAQYAATAKLQDTNINFFCKIIFSRNMPVGVFLACSWRVQ